MRAGTLPTPLCVGLGEACRIAWAEMETEARRLAALRDRLLHGLRGRIPEMRVNGDLERRLPGNLSLGFLGVETAGLLDRAAVYRRIGWLRLLLGQLRTKSRLERAGRRYDLVGAIRIGFGRFTTKATWIALLRNGAQAVTRLRDTIAAVGNASRWHRPEIDPMGGILSPRARRI